MIYDILSHATSAARKAAEDAVSVVADNLAPARPIARRELISRKRQRKQQARRREQRQERRRRKERSERDVSRSTVVIEAPGQAIGDAVAAHINSGFDLAASVVNAHSDAQTAILNAVLNPIHQVTITSGKCGHGIIFTSTRRD